MKHSYTGVTVGHKIMLGATMEYRNGEFMLVDAFKLSRQGSLREDCKRFITHFSLEGANLAVAAVSERRDQLMVTPSLSRFETSDLIKWQMNDYVEWPEEYYFYDFVIEDMPEDMKRDGDAEQQLVYVVALPKKVVTELATGILEGRGHLEIIDFFPGALMRRYVEHKGSVLALVGQHFIEVTGWYRHMCVCKKVVPIEGGAFQSALDYIENELFEYGIPGICGIALFKTDTIDTFYTEETPAPELDKVMDIVNTYEPLTPIPYTISSKQGSKYGESKYAGMRCSDEKRSEKKYLDKNDSDKNYSDRNYSDNKQSMITQPMVDEIAQSDPLLWDMALGMAIRGLYRPTY